MVAFAKDGWFTVDAAPQRYDWFLLDWKMPGMDGVVCAQRIIERHPELRPCILLVTAFARDDVALIRRCGDIEKHQLVGAFLGISKTAFDGVSGIAKLDKYVVEQEAGEARK